MSSSEIDYWSFAITIFSSTVALVMGIIAIIISLRQLRLQHKIAQLSGTFDTPKLEFSLLKIRPDEENIIIGIPIEKNRISEITLPFYVSNSSEKTAENVTIYARFPQSLLYHNMVDIKPDPQEEWLRIRGVKVAHVKERNFGNIMISIPRLPNYEKLCYGIPVSIIESTRNTALIDAKTKDNVAISAKIKYEFQYVINTFIACDGFQPLKGRYRVTIINTNESTLAEAINDMSAEGLRQTRERNATKSLPQKLSAIRKKIIKHIILKETDISRIVVLEVSKNNKRPDPNQPIDRYDTINMSKGVMDESQKTYWVPALPTTFFGQPSKSPRSHGNMGGTHGNSN